MRSRYPRDALAGLCQWRLLKCRRAMGSARGRLRSMSMTRATARRALPRSVVVALVVFALTGCENPGQFAPIAFSRDGDTLLIAVCTDMSVKSVTVSERVQGEDWSDLYLASGAATFSTGDVLRVPDGYRGLVASQSQKSKFLRSALLAVSLDATDQKKSWLSGFDDLSALKSGSWTNPRGKSSRSACGG